MSHHESSPFVALLTSLVVIFIVPIIVSMPDPTRLYADTLSAPHEPIRGVSTSRTKTCFPQNSPDFCYTLGE